MVVNHVTKKDKTRNYKKVGLLKLLIRGSLVQVQQGELKVDKGFRK